MKPLVIVAALAVTADATPLRYRLAPLIVVRNPVRERPYGIAALGTLAPDGVRGAGAQLTFEVGGGWPWWGNRVKLLYQADLRARFLEAAAVETVPIDIIGRASLVRFRERSGSYHGRDSLILTPKMLVPYAGLGASYVVPRGDARTNYGVLSVTGLQIWAGTHLALFGEVELRATFRGGADGSFAGNGGVLVAF
jgi:hypothetical protein